MKKYILSLLMIVFSLTSYTQDKVQTTAGAKDDFVYKDGKVGIGVDNPIAALHIKSYEDTRVRSEGIHPRFDLFGSTNHWLLQAVDYNNGRFRIYNDSKGRESFTILSDGKVGLGIELPNANFHIAGENAGKGNVLANLMLGKSRGIEFQAIQSSNDDDVQSLAIRVKSSGSFADNNFEAMRINYNGNVGIGTIDLNNDYKLSVNGKIKTKEIQVSLEGWSDFVFKSDYNLKPLEEVESFIDKNSHLPDIPSEVEVKEKGIDVGKMNAKLLQKIEELTLYLIDQNKEIKKLKTEILKLNEN
jgi:hypothetical protein